MRVMRVVDTAESVLLCPGPSRLVERACAHARAPYFEPPLAHRTARLERVGHHLASNGCRANGLGRMEALRRGVDDHVARSRIDPSLVLPSVYHPVRVCLRGRDRRPCVAPLPAATRGARVRNSACKVANHLADSRPSIDRGLNHSAEADERLPLVRTRDCVARNAREVVGLRQDDVRQFHTDTRVCVEARCIGDLACKTEEVAHLQFADEIGPVVRTFDGEEPERQVEVALDRAAEENERMRLPPQRCTLSNRCTSRVTEESDALVVKIQHSKSSINLRVDALDEGHLARLTAHTGSTKRAEGGVVIKQGEEDRAVEAARFSNAFVRAGNASKAWKHH
mmetsp:Transcript_7033/g.18024  ORF Transcript_7033/g.18024 Transcript_7033/m.18024 type:complete len:339 (-) Transcript_7033:117-1133(-)